MLAAAAKIRDDELQRILDLVREHTGIDMNPGKRKLLDSRLNRRLRTLGIDSYTDYCDEISRPNSAELQMFINSVTTNLTSFFRESHHFDHLAQKVLPGLVQEKRADRIRIWSAGCSTGAEPYSIAMTLDEALCGKPQPDWKILATDLDSTVLSQGRSGIYEDEQVEQVSEALRARYFYKGVGPHAGKFRIKEAMRARIVFNRLNLLERWPMRGPFDAVFCRNVAIYFDRETQCRLFERIAELMAPGATLYIGHSESLHSVSDRFRLVGKTVYERVS